jgi:hypothetical protein
LTETKNRLPVFSIHPEGEASREKNYYAILLPGLILQADATGFLTGSLKMRDTNL